MNNQKITPFLWFNDNAEEAVNHYTSVFENSKISSLSRMPDGKVLTVGFELAGQSFAALNGGPMYTMNPSVSFFVICETATEVDNVWEKLMVGGTALMALGTYPWSGRYGWGKDRFGLTWQVMMGKIGDYGQKIVPCMMFAGDLHARADEAIGFYLSVFKEKNGANIDRYTAEEPAPEGSVKHAQFKLNGNAFTIMGSAMPHAFVFNEALSFVVFCDSQAEIDYYWSSFTEGGGSESRCGWLKDKFGISWQIVPPILSQLLGSKDPASAQFAMNAMLKMNKIVIADLMSD
jgi:predicted 3-demethylubiquinone-9 3-methyltransferase (glyoxalase superfamily)